jgi:signal transduction histidine kinase
MMALAANEESYRAEVVALQQRAEEAEGRAREAQEEARAAREEHKAQVGAGGAVC